MSENVFKFTRISSFIDSCLWIRTVRIKIIFPESIECGRMAGVKASRWRSDDFTKKTHVSNDGLIRRHEDNQNENKRSVYCE